MESETKGKDFSRIPPPSATFSPFLFKEGKKPHQKEVNTVPNYKYRATAMSGKMVRGTLAASDPEALLNELKKKDKDIIIFIITSYSEYLDEAMRFHVFRYLSKPIDKKRLFRNLKDALDLYHSRLVKVPIETRQGVHVLPVSSIIMVEAQGKKVIVHTTTQDFEAIHTMPYWLELLPSNRFFQTHRSFIVNYEHITDFDRMLVHLANGQFDAYLTKRKYSAFKEAYLLYLESTR